MLWGASSILRTDRKPLRHGMSHCPPLPARNSRNSGHSTIITRTPLTGVRGNGGPRPQPMYYDSPVLFLTLRGPWLGARYQSGLRRNFSDQLYTWFGIISGRTVEQQLGRS